MTCTPNLNLTHDALCAAGGQRYFIGDDWSVKIKITDSAGAAVDLTGKVFHSTIRDKAGNIILARKSTDTAQIEVLNQVSNKGELRIKIGRAESVPQGEWPIDLLEVDTDSSEQVWGIGTFEAQPRVTPSPPP